jgi:hypothetical protein
MSGPNLKIIEITDYKFKKIQKIIKRKICKKLNKILRLRVKKFFQIDIV